MREDGILKILFLSTEYPPETGWGGIGTYTYHMAHALARSGHKVHVLSVAPSQEERHYLDGEVHVHRTGQRDLWRLRRVRPAPMPVPHLEKAVSTYLAYRRLDSDFDVIEYPEWAAEGLLFSLVRRKPTVAHLHTSLAINARISGLKVGPLGLVADFLEGLSVRRGDVITSPSQALADWSTRRFGLDDHRVAVIPHPAPIFRQMSDDVAVERPSRAQVLFVGRLEYRKNPEVIVRAAQLVCEQIPSTEFTFAGRSRAHRGTDYREWLIELAKEHAVAGHIHFAGHLPRHEVDALQRTASVLVVPSRWENCPYVVLEALVAGRPLVASCVGGIPEIIRDGSTGWLLDPEDTKGWAEAIVALLSDPQLARQMGVRAQEDALQRLSPAKVAAQREAVYRAAVALHQKRE